LEYEHLLRGSRPEAESTQDSGLGTHHVKRPCTVDLLSPASPTLHRLGTNAYVTNTTSRILSLHSPTTALAQLNFTHPSPVTEESTPISTPAEESSDASLSELDSAVFSQLPVTAVDQLCFTSCYACIDSSPAVLRHGVRAKRLLDDESRKTTADDVPRASAGGLQVGVALRSNVNRPLVRPSSIAFSSVVADDTSSLRTASVFGRESAVAVSSANASRSDHVARKSRSLEDILNSPPESTSEGQSSSVCSRVTEPKLPSAMEILGPAACGDVPTAARYWPGTAAPGDRQTDTSVSGRLSPGSRNSLHGSVEIIEVS